MSSYNLDQIIDKITEKTESGQIIWIPYDCFYDSNPYSSKYFSTINELRNGDGFSAKYQNGYIFIIPSFDGQYYLFLQANSSCLPVAMNYGSTFFGYSARIEELYRKIESSFSPIDTFLHQLLN